MLRELYRRLLDLVSPEPEHPEEDDSQEDRSSLAPLARLLQEDDDAPGDPE